MLHSPTYVCVEKPPALARAALRWRLKGRVALVAGLSSIFGLYVPYGAGNTRGFDNSHQGPGERVNGTAAAMSASSAY